MAERKNRDLMIIATKYAMSIPSTTTFTDKTTSGTRLIIDHGSSVRARRSTIRATRGKVSISR